MNPSQLRHRVTIQRENTGSDVYGQPIRTWSNVGTVWASVTAKDARETVVGSAITSYTPYRVTLRYGVDLQNGDRIIHDNLTLVVVGVADQEGRRRTVVASCTAGQQS